KEMEYRFRTAKRFDFELTITGFLEEPDGGNFNAQFCLKNTGDLAVRSPTISIRVPEGVGAEIAPRRHRLPGMLPGLEATVPEINAWKAYEKRLDLFEENGRVTIKEMGGMNPVLMPGHIFEFEALVFPSASYPEGAEVELEYRVDAEEMLPF